MTDLQRPVVDLVAQLAVVSSRQLELVRIEAIESSDGLEEALATEPGVFLGRQRE